jgi:hypothetical protein
VNKIRKPVEQAAAPKVKGPGKFSSARRYLRFLNVFGIFNKDMLISVLPFLMFLVFVGLLYISNSYQAEHTIREIDKLNKELKSLKTDYITGKSELMFLSNQPEVARLVESHGLRESVVAPVKIKVASANAAKGK